MWFCCYLYRGIKDSAVRFYVPATFLKWKLIQRKSSREKTQGQTSKIERKKRNERHTRAALLQLNWIRINIKFLASRNEQKTEKYPL